MWPCSSLLPSEVHRVELSIYSGDLTLKLLLEHPTEHGDKQCHRTSCSSKRQCC